MASPRSYGSYEELLADPQIEVVDIAVPPDVQLDVIRETVKHKQKIRGVLAQKPLGVDFAQAREIVQLCKRAGITLAVNQNMRYDQSMRACKCVLDRGWLGEPVFASIDMRRHPALDALAEKAGLGHAADHVDPSPRYLSLPVWRPSPSVRQRPP